MPLLETTLDRATAFDRLDQHTYSTDLSEAFSNFGVPNGGYVTVLFVKIATAHGANLAHDTIAAYWQFLFPAQSGSAIFRVERVNAGKLFSIFEISLYQGDVLLHAPWVGPQSRRVTSAIITNGPMHLSIGPSLDTQWTPSVYPSANLPSMAQDKDRLWQRIHTVFLDKMQFASNLEIYSPRWKTPSPSGSGFWIRLRNGQRISNSSLGMLYDSAGFLALELARYWKEKPNTLKTPLSEIDVFGGYRFQTVSLMLNVKNTLPAEGVEWLRMEVQIKTFQGGRYDVTALIFDAKKQLIAESLQVCLVRDNMKRKSQVLVKL
ncbi:hypothetical protein PWT90_04703 [Aphanocladium album]|nr:hypothetical protein PWT90_04703 [Aphanocladium album]